MPYDISCPSCESLSIEQLKYMVTSIEDRNNRMILLLYCIDCGLRFWSEEGHIRSDLDEEKEFTIT